MLHNRKILHHQSCLQTSEVFEIMEFMQLTRLQFVLCEPFLPMSMRYLFVLLLHANIPAFSKTRSLHHHEDGFHYDLIPISFKKYAWLVVCFE